MHSCYRILDMLISIIIIWIKNTYHPNLPLIVNAAICRHYDMILLVRPHSIGQVWVLVVRRWSQQACIWKPSSWPNPQSTFLLLWPLHTHFKLDSPRHPANALCSSRERCSDHTVQLFVTLEIHVPFILLKSFSIIGRVFLVALDSMVEELILFHTMAKTNPTVSSPVLFLLHRDAFIHVRPFIIQKKKTF